MNSPGWQVPNMLLEKSREIIPEDGKDGAKENNTQMLVWLVMEVSLML